ncbi:6756_t:CDS:10 [Paraglomus occultum]|uniref:Mediator of RNA polymerase II transcription subunit 17 n=1 Tax=Paraglomus occultum TaxID=144539 RepID=A0A9N9AGN4_9GLOM|nr:6756_t:CDS:10 [Paraglomus occultum]
MNEPLIKSLRVSLEPRLEAASLDVSDQGVERYAPKQTPKDKLARQIPKVWEERHFPTLTLDSLGTAAADTTDQAEKKEEEKALGPKRHDELVLMRHHIINAVGESSNEMGVGIGLLNAILASVNQNFNPTTPLPVAAGTIDYRYQNPPKPNKVARVQNVKLILGSKRKQLRGAADMLLSRAENLNVVVDNERTFWSEALLLRQNNWCMGAGLAGKQISVNYGYHNAGSLYENPVFAQILRTPGRKQIVLSLPQKPRKIVKVRLERRYEHSPFRGETDAIQVNSSFKNNAPSGLEIHEQLLAAQSAIFEAELFDQISQEAGTLAGSKMIENEISIPVYDNIDLIIERASLVTDESHQIEQPISPMQDIPRVEESSTCSILKLAMDLLLRRHHRRNIEKQQRRVLSGWKDSPSTESPSSNDQYRAKDRNPSPSMTGQVLSQPLHLLKYYFFCTSVREIITNTTKPLRNGGFPAEIHCLTSLTGGAVFVDDILKKTGELIGAKVSDESGRRRGLEKERRKDSKEELFVGTYSLRFMLESPSTVVIHLPHATLRTRELNEFSVFLSREFRHLLLKIVYRELTQLAIAGSVWEGDWVVDRAALIISRHIPITPVTIEHMPKRDKNSIWRRPIEITISHDSSCSRLVLRITSLGAPRTLGWNPVCHELVVGSHENIFGNSGKTNFGARVRDFLIGIK